MYSFKSWSTGSFEMPFFVLSPYPWFTEEKETLEHGPTTTWPESAPFSDYVEARLTSFHFEES